MVSLGRARPGWLGGPVTERYGRGAPYNHPSYVAPLAVILGLVIAFLASRVWANVDRAQGYVVEEASGIRQAVLMSAVLPIDTRDAVRKEIGNYLRFVDQVDWPAMLRGQEGIRQTPRLDLASCGNFPARLITVL